MKRMLTVLGSLAIGFGLFASPALAGGHEWHEEPHGHVMLLGVEIEGGRLFFDRCVELADGEALPVPAHHHSVHTGTAGGSPFVQGALWNAGHAVIPLAPFGFGTGCESFTSPFPLPH